LVDVDDVEEEFSEHIPNTFAPSSSSVKTRKMVREETEKAEKDKIFTTYESRSRKTKFGQKGKTLEEDDIL